MNINTLPSPQSRNEALLMGILGALEGSGGLQIHICTSDEYNHTTGVPTITNPDEGTLYLVPASSATTGNLFDEWVYVDSKWERVGSVDVTVPVQDVQVDGTSVVQDGVADIDTDGIKQEVKEDVLEEVEDDIPTAVASWLDEHVDPSTGYVVDDSLSIQGAAADAAKVGELKSALSDLDSAVFNITQGSINKFNSALVTSTTVSTDKRLYGNGTLRDATGIDVSPFMPIKPSTAYWMGLVPPYGNTGVPWYGQSVAIEFYSAQSEGSQISRIDRSDNNPITFTTPSDALFYRFDINRSSGITTTLLSKRCMLVEGSDAPTEFVPYQPDTKTSKLISIQDELDAVVNKVSQTSLDVKHHLIGTTTNGNVLIRNGTTVYEGDGLIHTTFTNISECVGSLLSISGKSNAISYDGKGYVLYGFYDLDNNLLLYHESSANTGYVDVQVTVPQNAVKLIVNGVNNATNYYPTAIGYSETHASNIIAYEKYSGSLYVSTKYNGGTLDIEFGRRGPNQLPDFKKITADGTVKYIGSTDMHSPFTIRAVNNIDGDDINNRTYTGGNHNYGDTGTSDYSATARNISFNIYADGKIISDGDYGVATELMIEWVNRVQGYNTKKSDGSGREIIEERHTIVFDGVNWVSTVELEPLEDVVIENYYGYQCPVSNYPNIHMIGADYKKVFVYTAPHDSGNSTPNVYVACSADDRLEMEVDRSYDMGKGTYYTGTQGFRTIASGKGYTFLIANLSAASGDIFGARGTYRFIPNY